MHHLDEQNAVIALERRILRTICASGPRRETLDTAMREIASHEWRAPEHQIVWEAFMRIPRADVASLRELLPAEATRMGFPDVNWELYFAYDCASPEELDTLVRRLLNGESEIK